MTTRTLMTAIFVVASLRAADPPRFEEASVKPAERCAMQNSVDPGRIALNGDPLKVVLTEAFKVKGDQIVGPSWLDSDCFTLIAKMPEGSTQDQLPAMLQTLLIERFKLVSHKEIRVRSGYALLVDKNGSKLKESEPNTNAADRRAGQTRFTTTVGTAGVKGSMTLARFASLLSNHLGGPVEDLTGLKGKYDIDVTWARDQVVDKPDQFALGNAAAHPGLEASLPAGLGSIYASLREVLGLRVEARKVDVDFIVIDSIERVPAEN